MWKCVDAELQWQIHCFPYVELSDVPRLQEVEKKSCRMAEESRMWMGMSNFKIIYNVND